jgi:UDP-2,3-diacylglucosamine pyrophosphatase LpxH/biotin operon repressor
MNNYNNLKLFIQQNAEKAINQNGKVSFKKLIEMINEQFPNENTNYERIRSIYRKSFDKKYKTWQSEKDAHYTISRKNMSYKEVILSKINKKYSISALASLLKITENDLVAEIAKLQFDGYSIALWQENGHRFAQLNLKNKYEAEPLEFHIKNESDQMKIAIFSDTHIGHKQSKIDYLNHFIHTAYERGVRNILFAGDLVEGHYMAIRPTSIKELDAIGFDDQIELANNVLPSIKNLNYYMISGNHDGSFTRNAFANPIKTLAKIRKDIYYLGHNFAKIWLTNATAISLVHPTDGISQSYDLKMKQHIDRARSEKLARFIFMGHYHKFNHTHYKGIDGFIMPSFIGHSHFMDDKNLASIVGGIIMTINFNKDGEVTSFIPEYMFFDDDAFYDN